MIHEHIPVGTYCPAIKTAVPESGAELVSYVREPSGALAEREGRWGVIVVPGGGYRVLAPSESEPAALSFLGGGCQAFVLRYSLTPAPYPTQLLELAGAVAYLRRQRERYRLSHIAVCGLSAGGHLTGCLCNLWNDPALSEALQTEPALLRPDAAVLCYPVISASAPKLSPVFERLLGKGSAPGKLSLETSVTPGNPPAFLWATVGDPQVPVEHSLLYASALRAAGVPFELHLFQNGPHAMSVATADSSRDPRWSSSHVAHWTELACEWLNGEALKQPGEEPPLL